MALEPVKPSLGTMVGERLREVRKARKLTQSQLAGDDFSVSYISAIERGQIQPSLRALEIFAHRLGLLSKDLLLGSPAGKSEHTPLAKESEEEETDWQLVVAQLLLLQGSLSQAIQSLQQLSLKAITTTQRTRALYLLALAYSRTNQWQESDHTLSEAMRLVKDTSSLTAIRMQDLQGVIHTHIHSHNQGLALHQQCREKLEAEQYKDIFLMADVYTQLGNHMLYFDRIEEARAMFTLALQQTETLTASDLAALYAELSRQCLATNEYLQGRLYAYKSLDLMSHISGQARYSELHHMLGRAMLKGDRDQALIYLTDASGKIPLDVPGRASIQVHLALWELAGENVTEAKNHAKQAQELLASQGDSIIAADALLTLGKVEYAQKHYRAGDAHFEDGLAMLERLNAYEDLAEQLAQYAQMLENRNELSRAIQYWKKAYETRQKLSK